MQPPKPIAEIVVDEPKYGSTLSITVASENASQWLNIVAPQFGMLRKYTNNNYVCTLIVYSTYNSHEVAEYLRSYNSRSEQSPVSEEGL